MKINSIAVAINLIDELNTSIKDNSSLCDLAKRLLEEFPEYEIVTTGYRTIKGSYNEDRKNIHWSHSFEGSKLSYKTVHGSLKDCNHFKSQVKGFDVHRFWKDLSAIRFLSENLSYTYIDEEEIMVVEILSEVVAISKETELEY